MPTRKKPVEPEEETATIGITLMIEGEPVLHELNVGVDDLPTFIIRTSETDTGVNIQVSTGRPFDKTAESLHKISEFFHLLASVCADEDFVSQWVEDHPTEPQEPTS